MSYDASCINASTITQLVCQHCIPASRGALPHVVHRIDEYLTPFLCHETFTAACEEGASIRSLTFLLEHIAPVWEYAVQAAVRGGHMHVLRWMTERQDGRGPWKADFDGALTTAAAHGHLELVQWFYPRGIDWHTSCRFDKDSSRYIERSSFYGNCTSSALEAAAEHGHLEVVQWIHATRTDTCTKMIKPMDRAVANGHLAVAQWLYTHTSPEPCSADSIDTAARNGHLELLKWLESKNLFEYPTFAMDGAAGNGHLEVVKWLGERAKVCTETALWRAVRNGHLEIADWLCNRYCFDPDRISRFDAKFAVENGHLDSVQWLEEHFPASFCSAFMEYAAGEGHLDVVKWLHEHHGREGCTDMAPIKAAIRGHLDVLQFLHKNYSANFSPLVIRVAASYGHLDVLLWLLEHRTQDFPGPTTDTPEYVDVLCLFDNAKSDSKLSAHRQVEKLKEVFEQQPTFVRGCLRYLVERAIVRGNVGILDWVNQFGIKLLSTALVRNAVARGNWRVLEWFHKNGFQVLEPDLLEMVVEKGQLDVARWLSTHGYAITSLCLVEIAAEKRNDPLVRWLVEHGPPLSLSVATTLALEYRYVEVTWWLAEADRVQLVLAALREDERKLLWWLLTRTHFETECGRDLIRAAFQFASKDLQLWLQEMTATCEGCTWCFGPANMKSSSESNVTCSRNRST